MDWRMEGGLNVVTGGALPGGGPEYLGLAEEVNRQSGGYPSFDERVNDFLAADAELVTAADSQLRFHGGALAT